MIDRLAAINSRSRIGRLLRLPLMAIPAGFLMTIQKGPARGMRWVAGSATHGCWLGTYEVPKTRAIQRYVVAGMTVYDIGAHAGYYTLIFSRLVGPSGRVYAFEPFPKNVQNLLRNLKVNAVANTQVVHAALAQGGGLRGFSSELESHQNKLLGDGTGTLLVPTISIDEAVRLHGLSPPSLIKVDVEGAESLVLEGARQVIRDYRPIWFIALHGDHQREMCWQFLEQAGYNVYGLDGALLSSVANAVEIFALPARRS